MRLSYNDYTVGWIAPLPCELASARVLLDEVHESLPQLACDSNIYCLGRMGNHNVVITGLPQGDAGIVAASTAATNLLRTFPCIRFGLLVGVGGGVPSGEKDIRLGDVVVGLPHKRIGSVVQYDRGANLQRSPNRQNPLDDFEVRGYLRDPPAILQNAVAQLQITSQRNGCKFMQLVNSAQAKMASRELFLRPKDDKLFHAGCIHVQGLGCYGCDTSQLVRRPARANPASPRVHFGPIGSGNSIMRNAWVRDQLAARDGINCFETEAAGLMKNFECLVIRGISDYCDSHKTKDWQPFASLVAAAYAKELLDCIPRQRVDAMPRSEVMDAIQRIDLSRSRAEALDWLAAPDPASNYRHAWSLYHRGTGEWLVYSQDYQHWKCSEQLGTTGGPSSLRHLWLNGQAGSGKSVLSARVIEDLDRYCSKSGAARAMFYFTFSDQTKQSWLDCLKSLLHQLAPGTPAIDELVKEKAKFVQSIDDERLYALLLVAVRSHRTVFIVLDALDESPVHVGMRSSPRVTLLQQIERLSKDVPHVKFLLTSRDSIDIEVSMSRLCATSIQLTEPRVNLDIQKYIHSQLDEDERFSDLNKNIKQEILEVLLGKAGGMFRWAECQIQRLRELTKLRESEIQETLKTLPTTLNETYQRMLQEIPSTSRLAAFTFLRWLAYAERPLRIRELCETLIIQLGPDSVTYDDRVQRVEGLFDDLKSLVKRKEFLPHRVGPETPDPANASSDDGYTDQVELSHFSVKEFLESRGECSQWYHLNYAKGQEYVMNSCLAYLINYTNSHWREGGVQDFETFPLLRYAVKFWFRHYRDGCDLNRILRLLKSRDALNAWRKMDRKIDFSSKNPTLKSFLNPIYKTANRSVYIASLLGFEPVVSALIASGRPVNGVGGRYGSALQGATVGGYEDIVRTLLAANADVNFTNEKYVPALETAITLGHDSIVKILADGGAEINPPGMTGLKSATLGDFDIDNIVSILVKSSTVSFNVHASMLALAAHKGYRNIVKVLLQAGALIDLQSFKSVTAIAASCGYQQILKNLIDAGEDVHCVDDTYGTLLAAAAASGHYETVQYLIKSKVDFNAADPVHGSAIEAAAANNHEDILKILLQHESISAQALGSALQFAAIAGNIRCAELLLANGADINTTNSQGSVLSFAALKGRKNFVKFLLRKQVNVNALAGAHGSAILAAAYGRRENIVQFLKENQAYFTKIGIRRARAAGMHARMSRAVLYQAKYT